MELVFYKYTLLKQLKKKKQKKYYNKKNIYTHKLAWLSLDPRSQTIQNLTAILLDEEASLTNEEESESALVAMKYPKTQSKENQYMHKSSTSGQYSQHRFICYNCNKRERLSNPKEV